MSYKVYFAMSTGLSKPITAPKGTLAEIGAQIERVEQTLGIDPENLDDGRIRWYLLGHSFADVEDETLCNVAEQHNNWVRWLYAKVEEWATTPTPDGEVITPEQSEKFWYGLRMIEVPPPRWTEAYYTARMESMYSVLRGVESEGVSFDAPKLTEKQAAAVINMFSPYLDAHDARLDVPRGRDYLTAEYEWCEKCGAVTFEDGQACTRRKCPIEKEGHE